MLKWVGVIPEHTHFFHCSSSLAITILLCEMQILKNTLYAIITSIKIWYFLLLKTYVQLQRRFKVVSSTYEPLREISNTVAF